MTQLIVNLPEDTVSFIEQAVAGGAYPSSNEVVVEALRLLAEEASAEDDRSDALRRDVLAGLAEVKAGRLSTKSVDDIFEEVLRQAPAE